MFTKHNFKMEMFSAVSWSYGKWSISIVSSIVPLVDQSVVKVWTLALLYKLTASLVEIFFQLVRRSLLYLYYLQWLAPIY